MKISNPFRENWRGLGDWALTTLDNLIASLQGAWKTEHTDEDQHGHVHATTLQVGRVNYSTILSAEAFATTQVNNFNDARLRDAGMLRVSSALAEVSLTGIQVPQDELGNILDGRVLVIENTSETAVIALEHQNDNSSPANRFIVPMTFGTGTGLTARYFLLPNTVTTIIYNAARARWVVYSRVTDELQVYHEFGSSQNDFAPTGIRPARVLRLVTTAANLTISGFSATNVPAPSRKTIINEGVYRFAILHMNTASVAANRVQCPGGTMYYVNPRESVDLYREVDGTWHIILKADQWIDVAFDANNFTASGGVTPTWVLTAPDQTTYAYQIDGNKMTVMFQFNTTTITGAPIRLHFPVPAGRVIARATDNPLTYYDGATGTGFIEAPAGGTALALLKDILGTAWTNGTDTAYVRGQITFMVETACASVAEVHQDVAHGDTGHADASHSDVAHVDTAHVDSHSDTAHSDTAHTDVAHSDVAHVDTAHVDVAHIDVAHGDGHTDGAHSDSHDDTAHEDVAHVDAHNDADWHGDFNDGSFHTDQTDHDDEHFDTSHSDTTHADTHGDASHADDHNDVAHEDTAHSDTAHVDTHSDTAHSDGGHADVAHADSHSDTVHSDVTHVDGGHSDTAHIDTAAVGVGLHCDVAHSDI